MLFTTQTRQVRNPIRQLGELLAILVLLLCIVSLWLCPFSIFASRKAILSPTSHAVVQPEIDNAIDDTKPVRLGLFSLFRPQQLTIRLVSKTPALLSAGNLRDMHITSEDTIHLRKIGGQIFITLSDLYARVKQTVNATDVHIFADETPTCILILPGKISRRFRGDLQITSPRRESAGALQIVLTAESKAVIASIAAAEINNVRYPEALKALAVVVRTYLQAHASRHGVEGFDFCDTTHCQFYRGEDDLSSEAVSRPVTNAVAATTGEVLQFNHHLLEGFYTAVCGGLTATPEAVWGGTTTSHYPYKRIACRWCNASPYTNWERTASAAIIRQALTAELRIPLSQAMEITMQKYPASDVVQTVIIKDGSRETRLSGDRFRRAIGRKIGWNRILSPTFTLARRGNFFVFRGRGFGSQVGLCIAGTVSQAQAGQAYHDILNFYYPQTESLRGQE